MTWTAPAPSADRCFMGAPVGDDYQCWAFGAGLWCAACDPDVDGVPPCDCPGCSMPPLGPDS